MRSNLEWKGFGDLDPLWGAASWEQRSKRGPKPWTEEEFYEYGKAYWEECLPHWQKYGLVSRACVEIGCGPGRITRQLASYFGHVHALDVSEGMIAVAKRNVPSQSVTFHLVSGREIPLPDDSVTAVFSCDVFQHFNTPDDARPYFEEMYRVLSKNGSIMIELPVYLWPDPVQPFAVLYRLVRLVQSAHAELRRMLMRARLALPFMHIVRYEVHLLANTLLQVGFQDVELKHFFVTGEGRKFLRPWIFARKNQSLSGASQSAWVPKQGSWLE